MYNLWNDILFIIKIFAYSEDMLTIKDEILQHSMKNYKEFFTPYYYNYTKR